MVLEQWVPQGCKPAGSLTNCSWSSAKRQIVLQVQNPEFYLGEPVIAIFDKIFESLVRRYHP